MKCKRLCAWLLSLVMMFSLLPVSAAAAEIPAEYKPTIEWTDIGGAIYKYTLTVNVYYEGKYVGKVSSSDNNLSAKVTVPSTMEVQKYEVTGHGCAYSNVSKFSHSHRMYLAVLQRGRLTFISAARPATRSRSSMSIQMTKVKTILNSKM